MPIQDKYIWIWELNRSSGGDIDALIQKAKDLGISGYILKTHDGSRFWYQASAITEFKSAGLKCGAWGYCYGRNVSGEIEAIKRSIALNPDFYVFDVESEFEQPNMRSIAEQMLVEIKSTGVEMGYSSFAIPSYHSVPFDLFSQYCNFTMPQIYWEEMGWNVKVAFDTSIQQYKNYNLPIYPVGQITKDVPVQEIQEFDRLCEENALTTVSYWNFQEAGITQLEAIKSSNYMTLVKAVQILHDRGLILGPDYWLENAVAGKTVKGDYAGILIRRIAESITNNLL